MNLSNQFLNFTDANLLAEANILFPDAIAWRLLRCETLFLIGSGIYYEIIDMPTEEKIAAPTLEELIEKLPQFIDETIMINKSKTLKSYRINFYTSVSKKGIYEFHVEYTNSFACNEEFSRYCNTYSIDPKIACAKMLLKLNELGLAELEQAAINESEKPKLVWEKQLFGTKIVYNDYWILWAYPIDTNFESALLYERMYFCKLPKLPTLELAQQACEQFLKELLTPKE